MDRLMCVVCVSVLVLGAGLLPGCGSVAAPTVAGTPDGATPRRVGGDVHGLWNGSDGVALRLESESVNALLTVSANGSFEFPRDLVVGASYTVTVATNPQNHSCAVDAAANGTITESEVKKVEVACTGPATSISLSGRWGWTFDPALDTQVFAGSVAVEDVVLTVGGAGVTGVEVAGTAVAVGASTAPIRLPLGMSTVPVALTAGGGLSKTYQLVFDRGGAKLEQLVYGKASNPGQNDSFGFAIALAGDTLVVGAEFESSSATGVGGDQTNDGVELSGAVYVFVRTGATWSQQAYIKASNTGRRDLFGHALALSGDTLVVGAPGESSAAVGINSNQADDTASASGAVYVFTRSGTTWRQQAYIKASNTGRFDKFGGAVALSGDTLAVGAIGESSAARGIDGDQGDDALGDTSGAVYVFTRTGATWTQQAYVKASNTDPGDNFGAAVALSDDTLVASATGEASAARGIGGNQANNTAAGAGAVYVFTRSGQTWTQQSYIKASNSEKDDLFGNALALSGDTLVVAAYGEDSATTGVNGDQASNAASAAGAAYVFIRITGTWIQQAYLKASNSGMNYLFGQALALSNDLLVVGAAGENSAATGIDGNQTDGTAPGSGAAYVFARTGTSWAQRAYVKASNTGGNDSFGSSLALASDTLVIGAPGESSAAAGINPADGQASESASSAGALYLFR